MITKLKTDKKVVGAKQVKKAINSSQLQTVFIADDAEGKVTDEIMALCSKRQIQVIHVENMRKLGDACGIGINAAVAALLI